MAIDKNFINKNKLEDIKKLNSGTKIKKNNLLTLEELLNLYNNSNKFIVINLCLDYNQKTLNNFLNEINKYNYNNLYLELPSDVITDYTDLNFKIGVCIKNKYDWDKKADFYEINYSENLDIDIIEKKLMNNSDIFINNINNKDDLVNLYHQLPFLADKIYIITKYPNLINKLVQEKE